MKYTCRACRQSKRVSSFYRDKRYASGVRTICKVCFKSKRSPVDYDKEKGRQSNLKKYKLTIADYDQLLVHQHWGCAICGATTSGGRSNQYLYVDHCHHTNLVRGLLCHHCNSGLGNFLDSPYRLKKAVSYLEKTRILG